MHKVVKPSQLHDCINDSIRCYKMSEKETNWNITIHNISYITRAVVIQILYTAIALRINLHEVHKGNKIRAIYLNAVTLNAFHSWTQPNISVHRICQIFCMTAWKQLSSIALKCQIV